MEVVPYIGTWIETQEECGAFEPFTVVPYIGTWIETEKDVVAYGTQDGRTLYRYVD